MGTRSTPGWRKRGSKSVSGFSGWSGGPDMRDGMRCMALEGADELTLGPRRDKPACSPIALFGACGQSFQSRKPLIVTDVNNLRAGYIACDPRDRSELVIPCMDSYDDLCWGVLDVDSHDIRSFTDTDVIGLTQVLVHMKLHVPQSGQVDRV